MSDSTAFSDPQKGLPPNRGQLNVILHGLFTILVQKDEITVYIPNMGSDHTYKAGSWLAEINLDPGDYQLEGAIARDVKDGVFDPNQNMVLNKVRINDAECCGRVYATLHLPLTKAVSLRRLAIAPGALGGDSRDKVDQPDGEHFSAAVQILTYDFNNDANLRLGDHPWEPIFDEGFVNLHVFAQPESPPEDDHIRHAFQMSMGLFTGVDLVLKQPVAPADVEKEAEEVKALGGIHPQELQGLDERRLWLGALGRAIKDHRDLNQTSSDFTPFDGPGGCSGSNTGNNGGGNS